jgi:hypothetical protein
MLAPVECPRSNTAETLLVVNNEKIFYLSEKYPDLDWLNLIFLKNVDTKFSIHFYPLINLNLVSENSAMSITWNVQDFYKGIKVSDTYFGS